MQVSGPATNGNMKYTNKLSCALVFCISGLIGLFWMHGSQAAASPLPMLATSQIIEKRESVGLFQSRAILKTIADSKKHATVILVPGSGANGPEEQMPSSVTLDGKDHSLFEQFSSSLNKAGVNTIQLGKPGIEYFSGWDKSTWFYDKALYQRLQWKDLVDNVKSAIDLALTLPETDPSRVYILGHSEGTQVAIDVANVDSRVKGIVLLGYVGMDLGSILDWQLYRRDIEFFVATDVDANKDGFVDKPEAALWSDFEWNWQTGQDRVSYAEIEAVLRADSRRKAVFDKLESSPLYGNGIFRRGEMHTLAASLKQDVFVFNGSVDMQTPASEATALQAKCQQLGKANCWVEIVPGVGHGFSAPRPPKSQPVVDLTIGPASQEFIEILRNFAVQNL